MNISSISTSRAQETQAIRTADRAAQEAVRLQKLAEVAQTEADKAQTHADHIKLDYTRADYSATQAQQDVYTVRSHNTLNSNITSVLNDATKTSSITTKSSTSQLGKNINLII